MILSFFTFTFLPFIVNAYSLNPAIGHIHPHQARPKKIPEINIRINNNRLPEITPAIAPSIDTYGDKKLSVIGNNNSDIKINVLLTFCHMEFTLSLKQLI